MTNVAQYDFSLFYEKTNISAEIEPHLIELSYTDYLEGQSDELSVTFEDIQGKWIRQWFPTQGDKLIAAIGYKGSPLVEIGGFEIDEVEYAARPSTSIWNRNGINLAIALEKPEYRNFPCRTTTTFAFASTAKITFIGFNFTFKHL